MCLFERYTFKRGFSAVPDNLVRTRACLFKRTFFINFTDHFNTPFFRVLSIIYQFYLLYGEHIHLGNEYLYLYKVLEVLLNDVRSNRTNLFFRNTRYFNSCVFLNSKSNAVFSFNFNWVRVTNI